jgi:hypothetical protein
MVQNRWTWRIPPATGRTDPPHQPLRHHPTERTGNQIRLNTKIPQGRDGAWHINCMQGTEELLSGEGGTHSDSRSLDIADFSDHENVSILA